MTSPVLPLRNFFESGRTRPVEFRFESLRKLRAALKRHESLLHQALAADMGRPELEAYGTETAFLYAEIDHALADLDAWARPKNVGSPLVLFPAKSFIVPEPKGAVLVIGPWNYPLQLSLGPVIAAIAAGNTVALKLPEQAPKTSEVVFDILKETFDPHFIAPFVGGPEVSQELLAHQWDHIFFTGGPAIGRKILEAAAKHLTPVTLELGGKSPCYVDASADLKVAAKRIVFGKFMNAGQTCVAPDYLLVHHSVRDAFLKAMLDFMTQQFGTDPSLSPDYSRIINDRHFQRLTSLMRAGRALVGGQTHADTRYIAPTVLVDVPLDAPIMQEEIFGPLLPVFSVDSLDEALTFMRKHPHPLAAYLFANDADIERRFLDEFSFGGGCINDTLMHLGNPALPFGGVGGSGFGAYHGEWGFRTFSHLKSVVKRPNWPDWAFRYRPYAKALPILRKIMK